MYYHLTDRKSTLGFRVYVLGLHFHETTALIPPSYPPHKPLLTGKFWGHFTGPYSDLSCLHGFDHPAAGVQHGDAHRPHMEPLQVAVHAPAVAALPAAGGLHSSTILLNVSTF